MQNSHVKRLKHAYFELCLLNHQDSYLTYYRLYKDTKYYQIV